jgi:hypothetical protein
LEELEADVQRLIYVLNVVSEGDPRVYSLALQSFLAFMNISWPDGVFEHDFAVPGRGRPLSALAIESWHLYLKWRFGWRSVANELLPKEYAKNPEKAANKVRKAAASFIGFRQYVTESLVRPRPQTRELLDEIIWVDGLGEIAGRVVDRKFNEAIEGRPVLLAVVEVDKGPGLEIR